MRFLLDVEETTLARLSLLSEIFEDFGKKLLHYAISGFEAVFVEDVREPCGIFC